MFMKVLGKNGKWNSKSRPENTITIEQTLPVVAVIVMGSCKSKSYKSFG